MTSSYAAQVALFGVVPDALTIIGAVLMMFSVVIMAAPRLGKQAPPGDVSENPLSVSSAALGSDLARGEPRRRTIPSSGGHLVCDGSLTTFIAEECVGECFRQRRALCKAGGGEVSEIAATAFGSVVVTEA